MHKMSQSRLNSENESFTSLDSRSSTLPQHIHPAWIAGYASGVAGLLVGHPLDSIKVWIQTNSNPMRLSPSGVSFQNNGPKVACSSVHSNTLLHSPMNIIQRRYLFTADLAKSAKRQLARRAIAESSLSSTFKTTNIPQLVQTVYRGVSTPIITVGSIQAVNFALYEQFKCCTNNNITLSSFLSGAAVSTITAPLVAIKLKQQVLNISFREALYDFRKTGGLYKGFSVHFLCDSLGRSIFFTTYEYLKQRNTSSTDGNTFLSRVLNATTAGLLSSTILYPCDVVRSQIQTSSGRFNKVSETVNCLYKRNGLKAFTRGYGVMVLRSGPVAAVSMPVYDMTMDLLSGRNK